MVRWVRPLGVALTLSACGAGCALFETGGWTANGLGSGGERHTLADRRERPEAAEVAQAGVVDARAPVDRRGLGENLDRVGLDGHGDLISRPRSEASG